MDHSKKRWIGVGIVLAGCLIGAAAAAAWQSLAEPRPREEDVNHCMECDLPYLPLPRENPWTACSCFVIRRMTKG